MAISVVMPALELAQETGKLVCWRKKEGERVSKGEPLLEIETDKAVVEIEAPAEGILAGIRAQEGAVVPVGQTIAWILSPGETVPAVAAHSRPASGRALDRPPQTASSTAAAPKTELPNAPAKISPKARRLAREQGVDISRLRGSGPEGEILASDVLAAAESKVASHVDAAWGGAALGAVARLMAERTTKSWTTVPHFFVTRDIDVGALVQARERMPSAAGAAPAARPSHTDLLIALVAAVLPRHPRLNASWTGDGIRLNPEINIAVAVAVEEGVVAPVIHNVAALKTIAELSALRRELAERARAGRLRPADISGATFTISNLGMHGVDSFTAIINPPQAAILAVGRIADRIVAESGLPVVRRMMTLTLSCDHRVIDGARAAAFLEDLNETAGIIGVRKLESWQA